MPHLITQTVLKPFMWLQLWSAVECGTQGTAESSARVDLCATGRTGIEMPQDFMIRLCQKLLTQKRVRHVPNVTTIHDASILSSGG
jgi:hypothetical protein